MMRKMTNLETGRSEIYRNMKRFLASCDLNKKYILFGINESTQMICKICAENGVNIKFFIDNDPIRQGKMCMGIPVFPPDFLRQNHSQDYIVIIYGGFWYEKQQQVLSMGYYVGNIRLFKRETSIWKRWYKFLEAYRVYLRLRKQIRGEMLLCPYPGTGDAYLTGCYIKEYIEKRNLSEYTILTTGNAFKRVLELFHVANIRVISVWEKERLEIVINSIGGERLGIDYLLYWGLPQQNTYRMGLHNGVNFHELFKFCSFYGKVKGKPSAIDIKADKNTIKRIIEDNGIAPGKTVILAPYANSFERELGTGWWKELAGRLKKSGYVVLTNSSGEKEPAIPGSNPLLLSYNELLPVLEVCGTIIGMRSGLFDLINTLRCRKIVLYQDFMSNAKMEHFRLANMYGSTDAYEYKIEIGKDAQQRLLEQVMDAVFFSEHTEGDGSQ